MLKQLLKDSSTLHDRSSGVVKSVCSMKIGNASLRGMVIFNLDIF